MRHGGEGEFARGCPPRATYLDKSSAVDMRTLGNTSKHAWVDKHGLSQHSSVFTTNILHSGGSSFLKLLFLNLRVTMSTMVVTVLWFRKV